ncbi:MAG: CHAP domain-containing protein [bacterium]|nr:CHAP domain-containing protein [bacterium]
MNVVNTLIQTAASWIGYLEKKSNKDLDSYTENAGSNNYTCFARDYSTHIGTNLQAQPWCAVFVSEMFVQAFGLSVAKKMLGGSLYHYCPTGVNQFKSVGRWSSTPQAGAVVFFTNGSRAYHTGIVEEVTTSRIKTIEGNTSGNSGVVANGGGVFRKSYSKTDSKILGYGIPDWSLAKTYTKGFKPAADGVRWWYQNEDGSFCKSGWFWLQEVTRGTWGWYLFDDAGYMLTGYQKGANGRYFFLNPKKDRDEGKCMVTDDQGALQIAEYDWGKKKYKIEEL